MDRRHVLCFALTLAAATCSCDPATFYNPKTGIVTRCEATDLDPLGDECAATYQRAGWEPVTGQIIRREQPPTIVP